MATSALIIGVGSHAVAIDPATGNEVWRTRLKSSSIVTVLRAHGRVYAGAGGEVFCLDETTGTLLWRNRLSGLGLGVVAFTGDSDTVAQVSVVAAAAAAAAAAGAAAASS